MRAFGSRVIIPASFLLLLALAGCRQLSGPTAPGGPALARADAVTTVEIVLDDFTAPSFCAGEDVHWTGKVIVVTHTTTNRGAPPPSEGTQHLVEVTSVQLAGTGLTTGATSRSHLSLNHSLQSPDPEDPFPTEQTLSFRERVLGAGGVIGFFSFRLKFVIDGTGEVAVDWVRVTDECR